MICSIGLRGGALQKIPYMTIERTSIAHRRYTWITICKFCNTISYFLFHYNMTQAKEILQIMSKLLMITHINLARNMNQHSQQFNK